MKKKCSKCKKEKPLNEFFKASRIFKNPRINKDGKSTVCKKCVYERIALDKLKNPEKYRELGRNWTKKNPERRKIIRQKYSSSPKGVYRNLIKRGKDKVLISQKDFIEWYSANQFENGKVPCVVDFRGPDPVPEHDSHGELIYLLREYFNFTKDTAFLRSKNENVKKTIKYYQKH